MATREVAETGTVMMMGTGPGTRTGTSMGMGTGSKTGKGTRMEREGGRKRALVFATSENKQSRRPGTVIQEVDPSGSQKFRVQDPAPTRRWGTEGRTWPQGRKRGNGDGNRDGDGDGR